jgi:hypothetical protein
VAPISPELGNGAKASLAQDVAAAGGWKDTEMLLTCYQPPDNETLLAIMSERRKLRESVLAG